jgi:inhibitor of cysteine peptidase
VKKVNKKVHAKKGESIIISLESNPSTGYEWTTEFDPKFLSLVKKEYVRSSNLVGAGGIEKFELKALFAGTTTLKMMYKKSWEQYSLREQTFDVQIDE